MAFAATTVWEVRTTGSDSNGGGFDPGVASPGTDFSQQDAAQITYTDLVIDAVTNTKITSAAHPFDTTSPGNFINITGGAGFTVQRVEIQSVTAGVATCDKAVGTVGSTGGTGSLGGAFASPGQAMSVAVGSNTVYVKAGTYTLSSTANIAGGRISITAGGTSANAPFQLIGYSTNRTLTNSDTPPELDAGASMAGVTVQLIFMNSNYVRVRNFKLRNPNSYAGGNTSTMLHMFGIYNLAERIDIDANNVTNWFGVFQGGTECHCFDVAVQHTNGQLGFSSGGNTCSFTACSAQNCAAIGFGGGALICFDCLSANNTGIASDGFNPTSAASSRFLNCVAYNNARSGFMLYYDTQAINCIATKNGAYGFDQVTVSNTPIAQIRNCAGWSNTLGNIQPGFPSYNQSTFQALTADPFTNAAGGDFSLNNNAGAGGTCRAAGYPSSYYTLSTSSFPDIGMAQHQDTGTTLIIKRPVITR